MNMTIHRIFRTAHVARTTAVFLTAIAGFVLTEEGHAEANGNGCGLDGSNFNSGWAAYGGAQKLWPVTTNYCWLVYINGSWPGTGADGGMQGADVTVRQDGNWWLTTYDATTQAVALCLPTSCFSSTRPGYEVVWNNKSFPQNPWYASAISFAPSYNCDRDTNQTGYPGIAGTTAAYTMVAGWPLQKGATNGGGEATGVTFTTNTNPSAPNSIWANNCVTNESTWGSLQGEYNSIFVGTPFTTVGTINISAWTTGSFDVDLQKGGRDWLCYIESVGGGFRNSDVGLRTVWNGQYWDWHARSTTGSGNGIQATYRCMPYVTNQ